MIMSLIMIALAVFVITLIALATKPSSPIPKFDGHYPYEKIPTLFTNAERSFYGVLNQAVGTEVDIFGKVRVADIIKPEKGSPRSTWQKLFNKIAKKHFDFVLCDKKDLSVLCVIELDDASHNSKKRQDRDEFLDKACEAAGVPIVHIPAKKAYVIDEVKGQLAQFLGTSDPVQEKPVEYPAPASIPTEPQPASEIGSVEKRCPKCGESLVKRVARKGKHAGKQFWACSAFPKCRHLEAIDDSI